MVRVVGVQPAGFWDLWCRFVAGVVVAGRDGCVVEVVRVVDGGFHYLVVGGVGVGLMMDVIERGLLPLLLLVKDDESILHLHEPRPLSIDVLPVSPSALDCSLPSHDGFLFLLKPFNFLCLS
jgi:hypothetical protein